MTKVVMMQGINGAPVEPCELSFDIANREIKRTFFRFLEIDLTNMIHKESLDTKLLNSFDLLSQSVALVNALTWKMYQYSFFPKQKVDPMKHINKTRMKYIARRKNDKINYCQRRNGHPKLQIKIQ